MWQGDNPGGQTDLCPAERAQKERTTHPHLTSQGANRRMKAIPALIPQLTELISTQVVFRQNISPLQVTQINLSNTRAAPWRKDLPPEGNSQKSHIYCAQNVMLP